MRLPVNNDDLTTMYESLIEILSKHGEFGDVLSWVETLYSKAKFGQPSEKKALSVEDIEIILEKLLLIPKPTEYKNPTIAELQKILDSSEQNSIGILPDGSIACLRPQISLKELAQVIFDALPAQREVRYPEKMDHDHSCEFDCKGCVDSGWNQAIDEFKKLNGG